ncbi:MAG: GAF domain-containing protein [Anaerolineae bacterium]
MERSDSLRKHEMQRLLEHRGVLRDRLLEALRATLFSNRSSVLPAQLPSVAEELTEAYFAFLREENGRAEVQDMGAQRAAQGFAEDAILRLNMTLRRFCREHQDGDRVLAADLLDKTEAYTENFLRGFLQEREQIVLREQEDIRRALQRTVSHYTTQMYTASQIAKAASSILRTDQLLETAVELIRERFDLYYVGIFLLDASGTWAELRAGTGEAGRRMLEEGHRLRVGGDSMIGQCIAGREARIALDVGAEAVRFDNPLLPDTHSEMALPLISRDEVLGAMTIQSEARGAFSEEDTAFMQMLADQLANALQNAALFEETQYALEQTAALYDVERSMLSFGNVTELLNEMSRGIRRILNAERVVIILVDVDAREVEDIVIAGLEPGVEVVQVDFDELWEGLAGWCIRERKPALSPKDKPDPRESPRVQRRRQEMNYGAILALPLLIRGEALGVITVSNGPEDRNFNEQDLMLLTPLANQAAVAIQNAQLLERQERSLQRTNALYEVASMVISFEDLSVVLEEIADKVAEVLPADRVAIIFFDLDKKKITHFARGGPGAEMIAEEVSFEELWDGLSGWVLREGQPALSPSGRPDPRESPEVRARREATQCGAILVVPVQYRDQKLGTVTAINKPGEPDFGEGDVELMTAIAGQMAAAMINDQRLRVLESRALQLQTAAEVTQQVSSVLDLEELLPQTVELVKERFDLYYAGVFLLDDTGRWAVLQAGTGEEGRQLLKIGHRLRVGGDSMVGQCVVQQQSRISLDVADETRRYVNPYLPETRSEMALPLISRGETLGAMTIQSREFGAFDEEDITVLETVAGQLANAIANARLFTEAQERYEELQELQRRLTGETWATYAARQEILGYTYDLSRVEPIYDQLLPEDLPDFPSNEPLVQQQGETATLTAPIALRETPVGVLEVERAEDEAVEVLWSEDDLALIREIQEQIALALENRLLFQQTTEALTETRALYEITRDIRRASSTEEILREAVLGLSRRPEAERVVAALLVPQEAPEALEVVAGWAREGTGAKPGQRYPLIYWQDFYDVFLEKGLFFTADVEADPLFDQRNLELYRDLGVRGMVALQISVQNKPYGIMILYTGEPYEFSSEDLRFYDTVTRAASVALENLMLLQTTREEAERRAFLNEIMQVASSSLNPRDLMRDVGQVLTAHFNMPTMLWRWDGLKAYPVVVYRHDGSLLEIEETEGCDLVGMPGVGAAVRWKRPIHWDFEQHTYPAAPLFSEILDELGLVAAFTAPLMLRDEVLGLISLGRQAGHPMIDDHERAVLESAAVSISIALENANLYQDAQETAERLREVDRLKSEFLANMSHELRTPLNSIIGFSRVMLKEIDGPLTEMQQTDLQAIYDSGRHLLNLINDILDLSKIEAGKMEFVFQPTDLREVIKGVLSTAIALVKEKPIELQQEIEEPLPSIVADERRIRQVILNLVGNAAKFTDEGYIRVSAYQEGDEVVVAVKDSGIGIPPEKADYVFQEFQQVDSSSTRRYGGTGLGLPVSKRFVEAHGGRIWFESTVDVGTTFYVALPIEGPPPEQPEEEVARPRPGGKERLVLTVDDDEGVITLFRRYLEKQGYRVVGLTRGDRVVAEAKRLQPFAITLDILMPDQDGWDVIQALKTDPETRDIPIIVCSIVSDRDKGLSLGVTDYLVKPILEQELLDALERLSKEERPHYVLVVDDGAEDRELLRRILEGAGYEVAVASGGMEAIAKIEESRPDLLVLDLMMPEMDGFAVLETLRSNAATRQLPVIVVTAKELTIEERERLNMQVAALLEKGIFNQDLLLEDVAAALNHL